MNFENMEMPRCDDKMAYDTMSTMNMGGMNMGCTNMGPMSMGGMCPENNMCSPIYECPEEKVCHRYINYEVPHIKPCNTRIINHHIYRHTFTPCFSQYEENVFENVFDQRCC